MGDKGGEELLLNKHTEQALSLIDSRFSGELTSVIYIAYIIGDLNRKTMHWLQHSQATWSGEKEGCKLVRAQKGETFPPSLKHAKKIPARGKCRF